MNTRRNRNSKKKKTAKRGGKRKRSGASASGAPLKDLWFPSVTEAASFFRVSKRTYMRHKNEPDYPVKTAKGYSAVEVRAFLERADLLRRDKDKRKFDKYTEEARLTIVKREIAELKLQKESGLLMPREEHYDEMRALASIFVEGLEKLPQQVAVKLKKRKIVKIAEDIVASVRREIADKVTDG